MEGTPQIALMMLVLGLLTGRPRPLSNGEAERPSSMAAGRRLDMGLWCSPRRCLQSRFLASFCGEVGCGRTLLERLAAVVSGDGLVLIGMAVPFGWPRLPDTRMGRGNARKSSCLWRSSRCSGSRAGLNTSRPRPAAPPLHGWDASFASPCWPWAQHGCIGDLRCPWPSPVRHRCWPWCCSCPWSRPIPGCKPPVVPDCWPRLRPSPWLRVPSPTLNGRPARPRALVEPEHGVQRGYMLVLLPRYGGFGTWAVMVWSSGCNSAGRGGDPRAAFAPSWLGRTSPSHVDHGTEGVERDAPAVVGCPAEVPLVAASMCMGSWTAWTLLRWWPEGQKPRLNLSSSPSRQSGRGRKARGVPDDPDGFAGRAFRCGVETTGN